MIESIRAFLQQMDTASFIIIIMFIITGITFYVKRKSNFIRDIVSNALIETEIYLNSNLGQNRLDNFVKIAKLKVPFIVKLFISKRILVTIIENFMNKISILFSINKEIDIIGNEESLLNDVKKDIKVDKQTGMTEIKITKGEPVKKIEPSYKDGDSKIYAELKAKTDWHGNPETSVTVGIQKKL